MKRSEINRALKELEAACIREHCYLPPFCYFYAFLYCNFSSGHSNAPFMIYSVFLFHCLS